MKPREGEVSSFPKIRLAHRGPSPQHIAPQQPTASALSQQDDVLQLRLHPLLHTGVLGSDRRIERKLPCREALPRSRPHGRGTHGGRHGIHLLILVFSLQGSQENPAPSLLDHALEKKVYSFARMMPPTVSITTKCAVAAFTFFVGQHKNTLALLRT